eukprot:7146248-Prymnesium_polylepis.1
MSDKESENALIGLVDAGFRHYSMFEVGVPLLFLLFLAPVTGSDQCSPAHNVSEDIFDSVSVNLAYGDGNSTGSCVWWIQNQADGALSMNNGNLGSAAASCQGAPRGRECAHTCCKWQSWNGCPAVKLSGAIFWSGIEGLYTFAGTTGFGGTGPSVSRPHYLNPSTKRRLYWYKNRWYVGYSIVSQASLWASTNSAGVAANGAPYYANENGYWLYYDMDCTGGNTSASSLGPSWLLHASTPDRAKTRDLDGDGVCSYAAWSKKTTFPQPPIGEGIWRIDCGDSEVSSLTLARVTLPPAPPPSKPPSPPPPQWPPETPPPLPPGALMRFELTLQIKLREDAFMFREAPYKEAVA